MPYYALQSKPASVFFFNYFFGFYLYFDRYEYRWADGVQIKKPIEVSAPKYVEYLMDWIESQLDDESIFPQKLGNMYYQIFDNTVPFI